MPPRVSDGPILEAEICDPIAFLGIATEWRALADRALEPNVFAEPAYVAAGAREGGVDTIVLLVWDRSIAGSTRRLLGAWPLARGKASPVLPWEALLSPVNEYAFLGTPVLDRDCAVPVLAAMLERIASDASLPKLLMISHLRADGDASSVFADAVRLAGSRFVVVNERRRAMLQSPLSGQDYYKQTVSSKTRQKLRQNRRRLAEKGTLTLTYATSPESISVAVDAFLALEADGWKGSRQTRGRAILLNPRGGAFANAMAVGLAREGLVTVNTMFVSNRPVAVRIVLRSGRAAFCWKTTYDENYRQFSPGSLLLEDVTTQLLSDRTIEYTDSCNDNESGLQGQFWQERTRTVDLVLQAKATPSVAFQAVVAEAQARQALKGWLRSARKRLKAGLARRSSFLARWGRARRPAEDAAGV